MSAGGPARADRPGDDRPDHRSDDERPGDRSGDQPVVSVRDAAVEVAGRRVWSHVTVDVYPGEFVAILGPNGVGKSTLIKAILGTVPRQEGDLRVLGRPAGSANGQVGYLPQRRSFEAGLRIRGIDIVRMGLDGTRFGLPVPFRRSARARADAARVDEVIERVGASAYARRPIGEISGGEQQRLLLAQAMVPSPRLLLLDEPLDSLDLPNQAAMAALLGDICAGGVAVMLVAHDVNPILGYLDQVVYLAHGGAVAGSPDEVITSDALSRLYDTPIEVLLTSDGRPVVVGHPEAPAHHHDRHP
jgi:zinc/manganese transport system ATP-binding protein